MIFDLRLHLSFFVSILSLRSFPNSISVRHLHTNRHPLAKAHREINGINRASNRLAEFFFFRIILSNANHPSNAKFSPSNKKIRKPRIFLISKWQSRRGCRSFVFEFAVVVARRGENRTDSNALLPMALDRGVAADKRGTPASDLDEEANHAYHP